ncbi:multidrug effflux MFS transporter [Sphingomonas sp. 28-63-12]|uniref:multidrug effflux MFS transporter n=1 Tax=Sphingomonas sp. 28-63-12 TaxID=1970434 RepID=UPI000BDC8A37|nr:MAG: MFS transporter [Sphingomonas sp. 28-63-12]
MTVQQTIAAPAQLPIGFVEFVALIASLMALTALGIDAMLPALPAIGTALGVGVANDRQLVIGVFLIGFGIAQLVHGPLADRFGRRPVLVAALAAYVVANLIAAFSASFVLLLVARFAAGTAIAASRVVTVALVRDCYSGRAMARVMSLAFMVFMAAPVLAPSVGELILMFGSWRLIFVMIAVITAFILIWFVFRMPETQRIEDRQPLSFERLWSGWRQTLTDRYSIGYTLAATALMGGLYGFINSVQQIVAALTGDNRLLVPVFIGVAGMMALANLLNSRIVMRIGTRRISHSALVGLVLLSAVHLTIAATGGETIYSFTILQALAMACFGLATANFSSMAMEKMGHIAGTASSVQGFISVTAGALIGAAIGQSFNGTTVPLYIGFLAASLLALGVVAIVERGRLFRPS